MRNVFILAFSGFLLVMALILAWLLGITLFFPNGELASYITDRRRLIQSHIDFLMMAQFLLIFALLFRQYSINPPRWLIAAACFGALFNPFGLLRAALKPKPPADLPPIPYVPHFPIFSAVSFTLITVGFLGSVFLIVWAAWKAHAKDVQGAPE